MSISHLPHRTPSPCPSCGATAPHDDTSPSDWFTPEELVAHLRGAVTVGTLRNYRTNGTGPDYVKVGRHVFYTREAVRRWLQERSSTREDVWVNWP